MSKSDETKVKEALADFEGRIESVIERGFQEWRALEEFRLAQKLEPMLYPRTSANIVFDGIARAAIREFGSDARCRIFEEPQTLKVCFDDRVVGRFKKGDEDGLGQNIPTQASIEFTDPQQSFPGLPPEADKVEFTYAPNAIGTKIETILVVARDGEHALWAYELRGGEGSGAIEMPLGRPDTGAGSAGADLVTPKSKPEEEVGEDR